jgi:bifunctional DNA-binding transcriptional regulator/antitoxin component of YhaV-PrlF toxin-antitoxin module
MALPSTIYQDSQIRVPAKLRRRAGLKLGDEVVLKVSRGVIVIVPRSGEPNPFMESLRAMQEEARKHGLDKLTTKEINAEIAAHRAEKRRKVSRRAE